MGLTILHSRDVIAAKGLGHIRLGYSLHHETLDVTGIEDLVTTLESLKGVPTAYVVRGAVADPSMGSILRRYRREPRHLVDTPQQWLAVDIDGRPSTVDVYADPQRAAELVRNSLPAGLREALCYYAVTGGAKQYLFHGHLWFWLDRPYQNSELRRLLSGYCDVSLYSPTQPHFTCLPIIEADPLAGRRRGILEGGMGWVGDSPAVADPLAAERELEASMSAIAQQKKGDRHRMVNQKAYFLGRHVATNAIQRIRVIECLISAAELAGLPHDRAESEVCRGLADGVRDAPDREAWVERLQRSETGTPKASYLNMAIGLSDSASWAGALGWDLRYNRVSWLRDPPNGGMPTARLGEQWRDEHALIAAEWLGENGIPAAREAILNTVSDVAHRTEFDPVRDVLDECDWDATPRLDDMLLRYFGVANDKAEWARLVARKWMIAAVARAYRPGCKADNLLVLEGPQGHGKSTALEILGLGYTREVNVGLDTVAAADALHNGTFLAVLTELDAMKRTGRAEAVKAFLSALEDHYRRAYARATTTERRSVIFAATTNDESYLTDPTGNRRFWPVWCSREIDTDGLRRDVYQLWAEAKQAFLDGEAWHLNGAEHPIAAAEQHQRVMVDTWEGYIGAYVEGKATVTVEDIFENALNVERRDHQPHSTKRVTGILRRLGYVMTARREKGRKIFERITQ